VIDLILHLAGIYTRIFCFLIIEERLLVSSERMNTGKDHIYCIQEGYCFCTSYVILNDKNEEFVLDLYD